MFCHKLINAISIVILLIFCCISLKYGDILATGTLPPLGLHLSGRVRK